MPKKPYLVEIEEKYIREVVIYAEDQYEAYDLAEEMCNNNTIEITGEHFYHRDFKVEATTEADAEYMPCFNKEDDDDWDDESDE